MTMNRDEARRTIESLNAVGSPVVRPVRPGLVALVRALELDHGPGGWPSVEMATLSALADEVERLTCRVVALEYAEGQAAAAERERCIAAAEDAYIAGKGAKGCIDAIRMLCGPNGPGELPAFGGSARPGG